MSTFAERYKSLPPRVKQVVGLAVMGMRNRTITKELGISERMTRAHMQTAFEVLGVESRLQLANMVTEMRLQEQA